MKCKVTREEQESARSRDTWDLGASWEQACRMGCQGDTAGVGRGLLVVVIISRVVRITRPRVVVVVIHRWRLICGRLFLSLQI